MSARTALLTGVLAFAVAGCSSPPTDVTMSTPTSVASPDVSSPATPLPSSAPEDSVASGDALDGEAPSEPGSYITLAEYDADQAAHAGTDVVLFFNADWCSTCKVARDNIQSDLSGIPSGLTIVVVDFDAANDLRQKYGVTVQHTFVQVDADGNERAKWSGSVTADEIAQNTV